MCDGTMWVTVDLLVGREKKRTDKDLLEEVQEWLDNVLARIAERNAADDNDTAKGVSELQLKKKSWKEDEDSLCYPSLQSRLEQLMGSDAVLITDRAYMQRLQSRIREEHENCVRKRIRDREIDEIERERQLILEGRMAIEEAPEELAKHPVFQITQLTSKILAQKQRKVGLKKKRKSNNSYNSLRDFMVEDNMIDPSESGIGLTLHHEDHESQELLNEDQDSVIIATIEKSKTSKYEAPLVKELRKLEMEKPTRISDTIEELYKMAELIVGPVVLDPFGQKRQYS